MRVRDLKKIRYAPRWFANRFERRSLILIYHRVTETTSDPWMLSVSPRNFAEQLEVIRKHDLPISLRGLNGALDKRRLPRRSVVVTFDDGYADNLYEAKPLLERYGVPATVFVATGILDSPRGFWWDALERTLLRPGTLPETLSLEIGGDTYRRELKDAASYPLDDYQAHLKWSAWGAYDPTPRHALYRALHGKIKPLAPDAREKMLDALFEWSGAQPYAEPRHRTLSREEVAVLESGGLIEVGAHTVTHPVLSALPHSAQRAEIARSKTELEGILNHPVNSFSYPFGSEETYTAETVALARQAGFACACSTAHGVVRRGSDRLRLPRMYVHDWGGDEFEERLLDGFYSWE